MIKLIYIFTYLFLIFLYFLHNPKLFHYDVVIATGSSQNHEKYLINLLNSILLYCGNVIICVWDLGLSNSISNTLSNLSFKKTPIYLMKFEFKQYPSYFNIKKRAGEYAWKPVIIRETYNKFKKYLIWLDAGCELSGTIKGTIQYIKKNDLWSLTANHSIKKYTYYKTIKYFNVNESVTNNTCCSGGIVGFKYPSKLVVNILNEWYNCALDKNCIAPLGSNRNNHRQDQSAFSIIVNLHKKGEICYLKGFNIIDHVDSKKKKLDTNQLIRRIIQ